MYHRVFLLLCLIIFVNAVVESNVCTTVECINASSSIRNYMDKTTEPCNDFYNFVCGKFVRETDLPKDKFEVTSFSRITDKFNQQLEVALLEPSQQNELHTFKLAKDFFNICMNVEAINKAGIKPMEELLEKYGGWPVTKGENQWIESDWDWIKVKQQLFDDGLNDDLIVNFAIRPKYNDASKRAVFIDCPPFDGFLFDGLEDDNTKAYYNYLVDLAVIFGADQSQAQREIEEAVQFEMELAEISLSEDGTVTSNVFSLKKFQEEFPLDSMNWRKFIEWNLNNPESITDDEPIYVTNVNYLKQLNDLLKNTPNRTVANYFGMRLAYFGNEFLSDEAKKPLEKYKKEDTGATESGPRSTQCIKKTKELLPISTASIYIAKYFDKSSKDKITVLINSVKNKFIDMLKNEQWLDGQTRQSAITKANAITFMVAYPDELIDTVQLEEYYRDLELQSDSLLQNVLRIRKFSQNKMVRDFREPIVKNDWRVIANRFTQVNAFYFESMNSFLLTAGFLQGNYYNANRPAYMNYGTLGWVVGHEITHGFDEVGRKYDADGSSADWWDKNTLEKFKTKTQCFIDKYSKYTHPTNASIKVNGVGTLDENIADVAGFKAAYGAYQRYVRQNGAEPTLPDLDYTPNQLFWIWAAHSACGKRTSKREIKSYVADQYPPFNYRINGALSTLTAFLTDFNCADDSRMGNPTEKCELW